jgi:hypothetical protein
VKSWIAKINNIPGKDRTDEQKTALNQWTTPLWVPDTLNNTNRQLYVGVEARPQKAAPRTPKVANPTLTSPPVDWARWLYHHRNGANTRPGIQKTGRGVNLRTVRGMMLVQQRAPAKVVGVPEARTRANFVEAAIELIATVNGYHNAVTQLGLNIAMVETPGHFNKDMANVTTDDVVRSFAEMGVRFADIDDAYLYATSWLRDPEMGPRAGVIHDIRMRAEADSMGDVTSSTLPMAGVPEWWYPGADDVGHGAGSSKTANPGVTYPPQLKNSELLRQENRVRYITQNAPAFGVSTVERQRMGMPGSSTAPGTQAGAALGTHAHHATTMPPMLDMGVTVAPPTTGMVAGVFNTAMGPITNNWEEGNGAAPLDMDTTDDHPDRQ